MEFRCIPQGHPTKQHPILPLCPPASPHQLGGSGGSPSAVLVSRCPARSRRWIRTCSRSRSFCSSRSAAVCRLFRTRRPMFSSWQSRREASAICSCSARSRSRGSWGWGTCSEPHLDTPSPPSCLTPQHHPQHLGSQPLPASHLGPQHPAPLLDPNTIHHVQDPTTTHNIWNPPPPIILAP